MPFLRAALIVVLLAGPAYAYIDAGTGSMLIQAAIAAVAGGMYFLKTHWRQLRARFGRQDVKNEPELGGEDADD